MWQERWGWNEKNHFSSYPKSLGKEVESGALILFRVCCITYLDVFQPVVFAITVLLAPERIIGSY